MIAITHLSVVPSGAKSRDLFSTKGRLIVARRSLHSALRAKARGLPRASRDDGNGICDHPETVGHGAGHGTRISCSGTCCWAACMSVSPTPPCGRGPMGAHVEMIDQREGEAAELALRRPGELFSLLPTV